MDRLLTDLEVREYLKILDVEDVDLSASHACDIDLLDRLTYCHQTHVPFQTISIHDSGEPPATDTDSLYEKVVEKRWGGYCYEVSKLYQTLLEALGYDARSTVCRFIRGRDVVAPFNHRAILVNAPEGYRYVDVGLGGPVPPASLLLQDGLEQDLNGETYLPAKASESQWDIYRVTRSAQDAFDDEVPVRRQKELSLYLYDFLDQDFEELNRSCSMPGTIFRDERIVNLRQSDGHRGIRFGKLTLKRDGVKEVVDLPDDAAVADALDRYFGIRGLVKPKA